MSQPRFDVPLSALDPCFEGGVPATLCTCARDGTPNIGFLSLVHRLDDRHVALSFQFFRKTKANLAENPKARLMVIDPTSASEFRLDLEFVRTETRGPVFEHLDSRLSAVASQTGVEGTFRLRGADIYLVTECQQVANGVDAALSAPTAECLSGLLRCTSALAQCSDLDELVHRALVELDTSLGYRHCFLLAADEAEHQLFSVASRGYLPSGVGGELAIGVGLIGTAAERRVTVRVASMSRERTFAAAVRHAHGQQGAAEREIALPGLSRTESQLVVPLVAEEQLLGLLCVQSETPGAFSRVDEEVVGVVAQQLATGMARLGGATPAAAAASGATAPEVTGGRESVIRYYAEDDSVFVDNHYLIKGVAGRVLWLLLCARQTEGRREFSNRELRLDSRLGLPPVRDNLETRLIMLRKRLEEKCGFVRLRRLGRGRFALEVDRVLRLEQG